MPEDVDNGTGISSGGRCESKRREGEWQGEDGELYYQERETMRWTEKLKTMGSRALGDNSRGDCEVDERVVVTDVSNVKVIEGMAETTSETPIKVISSDIRTLRNGNSNRRGMVGVFRHTLGRRDSCQW